MNIAVIIAILILLLFIPTLIFVLTIWRGINPESEGTPAIDFIDKMFMKNPSINPFAGLATGMASMFASIPDALFIGSFLLAILFRSLPLAMIFSSLLELSVVRLIIGSLLARIKPDMAIATIATAANPRCKKPGIDMPTMDTILKAAGSKYEIAFPSDTIFILGGLASYIVTSLYQMKDVLKELGSEWELRFYISLGISIVGLLFYTIYQLTFGCSTIGPLILSILLSLAAGALISLQNKGIFGKEAINILGLPFLDERVDTGGPIYACAKPGL